MGVTVDPLADGDYPGMTNDGNQVAVTTGLHTNNTKAFSALW
jgi:hypothetical protein